MTEKTKQILAYVFGPIGGLVFFLLKDSSKETKYHAAQSITIGVVGFLLGFVPFVKFVSSLAILVFAVMGIIKAVNEEDPKLPGVSNIVDAVFAQEFAKAEPTATNEEAKEVDAEITDSEEE